MIEDPYRHYRNCDYCGVRYEATRHNQSGFCNHRHRNLYYEEKEAKDPRNIAKKREEEEAEIERLYREMQMQQNEPKKKNPLTQLIEAL